MKTIKYRLVKDRQLCMYVYIASYIPHLPCTGCIFSVRIELSALFAHWSRPWHRKLARIPSEHLTSHGRNKSGTHQRGHPKKVQDANVDFTIKNKKKSAWEFPPAQQREEAPAPLSRGKKHGDNKGRLNFFGLCSGDIRHPCQPNGAESR